MAQLPTPNAVPHCNVSVAACGVVKHHLLAAAATLNRPQLIDGRIEAALERAVHDAEPLGIIAQCAFNLCCNRPKRGERALAFVTDGLLDLELD